jgi:hypothetical protein
MPNKFTYEYVKKFIEDKGCQLISEEYIGITEDLEIVFSCGHTDFRCFNDFKTGTTLCWRCAGSKKYNFDEVVKLFLDNGYKLLSENYLSCTQDLTIEDNNKYKYFVGLGEFLGRTAKGNSNPRKFDLSNPYKMENIKNFLAINFPNFYLEENQIWEGCRKKINFFDKEGYRYAIPLTGLINSLKHGWLPSRFEKSNDFTLYNIQNWIKLINNRC